MSQSDIDAEPEKVSVLPSKRLFLALAQDIPSEEAIMELVDNAIDNWTRVSDRESRLNVWIDHRDKDGTFVVKDDSGGFQRGHVRKLFALGDTLQHDVIGGIGIFGVGAKKGMVALGKTIEIESHFFKEKNGYRTKVERSWFEDDSNWEIEVIPDKRAEKGTTSIMLSDLNFVFDNEFEDSVTEILSRTYGLIMKQNNLHIILNGKEIEPPDEIDWSYVPFSGLHPRKYINIELFSPELEGSIEMDLTVGLMRFGSQSDSGVDVYCNGRLVEYCGQGERFGFKTGAGYLGRFTSHHDRFRAIVELRATGPGTDLPWTSQKDRINPRHPCARLLVKELARHSKDYFKADTNKLRAENVTPFNAEHDEAGNGGRIETVDRQGKANLMRSERPKWPLELPGKEGDEAEEESEDEEDEDTEELLDITLELSEQMVEDLMNALDVRDEDALSHRIGETIVAMFPEISIGGSEEESSEIPDNLTVMVRIPKETFLKIRKLIGNSQATTGEVGLYIAEFIETEITTR